MVAATRKDPKLNERKDLLALFVQQEAQDFQAVKATAKNSTPQHSTAMTTEWLRDVVLNFVIAGRDTTACTLSWMFFLLATNPDIQKTLQGELDAKFPVGSVPSIQ